MSPAHSYKPGRLPFLMAVFGLSVPPALRTSD